MKFITHYQTGVKMMPTILLGDSWQLNSKFEEDI